MTEDAGRAPVQFEPLRPATRRALIVGVVLGPLLWLVVIAIAAGVFEYRWAIALGLAVTAASFFASFAVLTLLRFARVRQEERYVAGG